MVLPGVGACIGAEVGAAGFWHGDIHIGAEVGASIVTVVRRRQRVPWGDASPRFVRGVGWNQWRGLQSSPVSSSLEPPCCSLFHQRLDT